MDWGYQTRKNEDERKPSCMANSIQLPTSAANNHNLLWGCWEQFMIMAEWYENGKKSQMSTCAKSEPFGNSCNPLLDLWCHWPAATSNPFPSLTSQIIIPPSIVPLRNKRTIGRVLFASVFEDRSIQTLRKCIWVRIPIRLLLFMLLPSAHCLLFSCWHWITTINDLES